MPNGGSRLHLTLTRSFVAVDDPYANKLTVHILAAVAQHEWEMISERTKAALQGRQGAGDGAWALETLPRQQNLARLRKANARRFAANGLPIIKDIERSGATSGNAIAAKLNGSNVKTARGGKWTYVQVGAVLLPFDDEGAVVVA